MTEAARITVTGKVQGVGFRAACAREAKSIGVAGAVRNLADGSVQVVAEGTTAQLEALTRWCHRGPAFAVVRTVDLEPVPPSAMKSFRILR